LTFNVCTNSAGADFATGLGSANDVALGLRLLPTGGLILADSAQILRLNAAGTPVQTYDATNENHWVGVALDPDGQSFWASDSLTHDVYRFNITSGAVVTSFLSGTQQANGISVGNQITVAQALRLTMTPHLAENLVGTTLTLTAHLTDAGIDQPGVPISFRVSGANTISGTATTNASGVATFTYTE
jgi:hypothetical protein